MSKRIKGKLINYGFQTPELKIEDHIFGGGYGDAVVINPSGQWDSAKPLYEPQADNFETQGCTVWGTENALEFLHKFKFGTEKNYEELPPYIGAGLRPESGGDPNKVAQWIHENGLIEEPAYQFPTTLEELKSLLGKPVRPDILAECKKWPYEFRHQWVLQGVSDKRQRMDAIKGALQYGVLGVSVTAWFKNEEGVYIDNGMRNTHWCVCYGWTDKGWKIFDSYDQSEKIYSFDSVISFAKLYFLEKKVVHPVWTKDIASRVFDFLKDFFKNTPQEADIDKLEPILVTKQPPEAKVAVPPYVPPTVPEPKYKWDFPSNVRHSVRLIADEEGLTVEQKNTLCATVGAESGWKPSAKGKPNSNGTIDWGICQINDNLWIGEGKPFPSTDYVLSHPEECIRWMCGWWKKGKRNWWIAYKNGSYKKYL